MSITVYTYILCALPLYADGDKDEDAMPRDGEAPPARCAAAIRDIHATLFIESRLAHMMRIIWFTLYAERAMLLLRAKRKI